MILNAKYYSDYSSCTKCNIVGDYLERRVCFSDYIGQKRSDNSFADHVDEEYHQGTSPLENIPKLGLVTQVPLDYQHLFCLGVVKKNVVDVEFWKSQNANALLLSTINIMGINTLSKRLYP